MRIPALAAAAGLLAACNPSDTAAQDARSYEDIERIVRDYIVENPEIIEEALVELQRRAQARERDGMSGAVQANAEALFESSGDPAIGPEDAAVTIVEFFDYRCPYCRMTNDWVQSAIDEHGRDVRVIFKEFPVLGEQSEIASQAAMAVWINEEADTYRAFHDALISNEGPLPAERIDELAEQAGADVAAMRETMDGEQVAEHIAEVRALAREIGITGTPFFIVGEAVIPGADIDALDAALDEALAG